VLGIHPEIVLFGLAVGVLIGLTGIGGGSLMTPLMIIVLGVAPVTAVGTDLAYSAITKTFGGVSHFRKGTVDLAVARWLGYGGVPGALLGAIIVNRLSAANGKSFDKVLLACVAGALLIVATVVLVRNLLLTHLNSRERHSFQFTSMTQKVASVVLGFVLGGILGLTSVGTGALIGVAMLVIFQLTPQRVAGTSVFLGAVLLWVAGIGYAANANIDFGLMGNLLIGSIPGVWLGAQFVDRVPAQALRVILGAVLLGSALAMASKAGAKLPASVIVGAPVVVALVGYLLHRIGFRRPPETTATSVGTAASVGDGGAILGPAGMPIGAATAATEPSTAATEPRTVATRAAEAQ
jgi:uncharacterized membrane protein YfcA